MNNERNETRIEDYGRYLGIGLSLAVLLIVAVSYYWLSDSNRLTRAAEELHTDRMALGEEIYKEQCAACHGADGEGGAGPALNDRALLKNTLDEVFYSVIRSGIPNTQMLTWSVDFGGPLTDEEIRDVVTYMRAWEPTAPEVFEEEQVADPSRGATFFASTCSVCHGENGKEGQEGVPVVNDPERLQQFDDAWYRDVIANGHPAKGMPTWGYVLSPIQVNDLVALITTWREGEKVTPAFSETELIDRALYALTQGDTGSAHLHIERALEVTSEAGADLLGNVISQLEAGDLLGAQTTLEELQEQLPLGDPTTGATLYSANCSACHGPQGEGGAGPAMQNNAFIQTKNNTELVQFILQGRPGTAMIKFEGRLSEAEVADMVAFLRLWQK